MENLETRPETSLPPSDEVPPPPPPQGAPRQASAPELPQKGPILAAFLSALPGLGNVYNGLYRRAIVFFLIWVSLFALAINGDDSERAFVIPCLVFFWFFNLFDAYRQATLMNFGYRSEAGASRDDGLDMGGWGLAPGIFLLVLGLYGLLRRYFNIDLSWVFDQWPLVLMAVGAWMIYRYIREQRGAEGEA